MKLLRILGVFLVLALFSGCEVWISFWGAAEEDRSIKLELIYPSSYGSPNVLRWIVYENVGGTYSPVRSDEGGSGNAALFTTIEGLRGATYKFSVWNDGNGNDNPDPSEQGFTTGPIELFLFSEYTVEANTTTEWQQDGSPFVTPP